MKSLSARRRHPLAGLAVIAFLLGILGFGYATFSPTAEAAGNSSTLSAQQVAAGKGLFTNNCSTCHGISGQGQLDKTGRVLGPSLIGVGWASCEFQVGTGRMPAAGAGAQIEKHAVIYSQQEIDAFCAYIASLGPGPGQPVPAEYSSVGLSSTQIALGGELFRYNCSQCHGAAAGGGALAEGAYAPKIAVSGKYIIEAMLSGPQQMPVFSDPALSPKDKNLIVAYLDSLRSQPNAGGIGFGRVGTVTEGLVGWLVGIGGVVLIAVWLTVRGTRA